MRIKTLFITTVSSLLLVGLSTACRDENKGIIGKDELPESVSNFLSNYFANNEIISIKDLSISSKDGSGYIVKLEDGITNYFYGNGEWYETTADNGLPTSAKQIIRPNFLQELNKSEPNATIVGVRRSSRFFNTIAMQTYITMDNSARYIDTYWYDNPFGNHTYLAKMIDFEDLPQSAIDFLTYEDKPLNMAPYISKVNLNKENEKTAYRVSFGDRTLVFDFDGDGNWMHMQVGTQDFTYLKPAISAFAEKEIPKMVMNMLNDYLSDFLNKKINLEIHLSEVTNYKNGLYGFKYRGHRILIDESKGIIEKKGEKGKEFFAKYFPSITPTTFRSKVNIQSPYHYSFQYRMEYEDKNTPNQIELKLNSDFTLNSLSCSSYLSMPSISSLLPDNINKHLNNNYKDIKFNNLAIHENKEYTYSLYSIDKFSLYFDRDGNFVKKEESN